LADIIELSVMELPMLPKLGKLELTGTPEPLLPTEEEPLPVRDGMPPFVGAGIPLLLKLGLLPLPLPLMESNPPPVAEDKAGGLAAAPVPETSGLLLGALLGLVRPKPVSARRFMYDGCLGSFLQQLHPVNRIPMPHAPISPVKGILPIEISSPRVSPFPPRFIPSVQVSSVSVPASARLARAKKSRRTLVTRRGNVKGKSE
jgi:hypothetical protein